MSLASSWSTPAYSPAGWTHWESWKRLFRGKKVTGEDDSFDYVVAGAGSAGCAVAARLSESGRYRVLLLEAGGKDRNLWIHIPMGFSQVYANPHVNWMYESEPEARLD